MSAINLDDSPKCNLKSNYGYQIMDPLPGIEPRSHEWESYILTIGLQGGTAKNTNRVQRQYIFLFFVFEPRPVFQHEATASGSPQHRIAKHHALAPYRVTPLV